MATKFETKHICRLVREISPRFLHAAGGFRGRTIECCQTNSTTTNFFCYGNEIWDKNRL